MGKGDTRRPLKISHKEEDLRWLLAFRSDEMSDDEIKAHEKEVKRLERERT